VSSIVVFGCATAPKQEAPVDRVVADPSEVPFENSDDQVKVIIEQFALNNDLPALEDSLLALAQRHQQGENCPAAETILNTVLQLPISNESKAIALVIRSECKIKAYFDQQKDFDSSQLVKEHAHLQRAERFGELMPAQWQNRKALVDTFLSGINQDYSSALIALLNQNNIVSPLIAYRHQAIFAWLGQLSADDRLNLIQRSPELLAYAELINIIENSAINDALRQQQIAQWIQARPNAELAVRPPAALQQYLDLDIGAKQRIAVILPLSGRLEGQGQAIKQGILAGYYEQIANVDTYIQVPILSFIDSSSDELLNAELDEQALKDYNVIVGPLLKSHIAQVDALVSPTALRIFLNDIDDANAQNNDTLKNYFALSPEQEAMALAAKMRAQSIRHPVVIHDSSSITNRMAQAFITRWAETETQALTPPPSIVRYADNKSMRAGITSALDVLQSQQRINQMTNLSSEKVFSVTRNRRDVDAFVVFARPNEVELINPIIESSMSLFTGEQLPVFATSYSYNHKQNRNSLRDLRNLVFVDMPFVFPEGRESPLARQADVLFNEPSSTFLRLFSFGYDAIHLSSQALTLRMFHQIDTSGLSGELSIDSSGTVQRELNALSIQSE
jgi:outer membrane PBP1 activator LpoA protein